jgi:hypothetical protein
MDFSRVNSLEDFLEYYFGAFARAKYKSLAPYIAYSKEDEPNGERFIVVGSIRKIVTNQKCGSYEEYSIPIMECITIGAKGKISVGDSRKCSEIIKKQSELTLEKSKTSSIKSEGPR